MTDIVDRARELESRDGIPKVNLLFGWFYGFAFTAFQEASLFCGFLQERYDRATALIDQPTVLALVYYRTGSLFVAIGLHAFMNTPTLLVGPQGLGATYAVYLAVVVAVGWPWFQKAATWTGLTGATDDTPSVSE